VSKALFLIGSPRRRRSRSIQLAEAFLEALGKHHDDLEVDRMDLFEADLPAFDGPALQAKYEILSGGSPSEDQRSAWSRVEEVIERFTSADLLVLAVPMWNFGIPYRLKQFFDVIVQPGYTFRYDPAEGYTGLVKAIPAYAFYARGGDYDAQTLETVDHQARSIELILGFMGFERIESVVVQPTLMGDEQTRDQALSEALSRARNLAAEA
jgi:FMN-dependent NADH-azoreductase